MIFLNMEIFLHASYMIIKEPERIIEADFVSKNSIERIDEASFAENCI